MDFRIMKHILAILVLIFLANFTFGQDPINIGLKFGNNRSTLITNFDDVLNQNLEENEINNYLAGAFARVSVGRVYLQPEVYFNTKGGIITPIGGSQYMVDSLSNFSFQTIDIPVLIGVKLINKSIFNLRLHGGPVFSYVTSKTFISEITDFKTSYLKDRYVGWQLGAGVDIWFLTFDARIENTTNLLNEASNYKARNKVYLLSAGIKLF